MAPRKQALRLEVRGEVQGVGLRDAVVSRARSLGVYGWVRHGQADDVALLHLEGPPEAVASLVSWLESGPVASASVSAVEPSRAKVEGHEQFAIRGVPAGVFVVQQHLATAPHFDFRLEVDGAMRSWAVPKGPSLDPATKRFAVQVDDHSLQHNSFEGVTGPGRGVIIWDQGSYEQGGRVAWPEAIDRGHAVFVLHGAKLSGGFALQRTRSGPKPQWLLIKRRDEFARPGSDITTEQPASVRSGVTLQELLSDPSG
jgi:DNA ligase D-like protein (predicted 3'-phosphoesterase)